MAPLSRWLGTVLALLLVLLTARAADAQVVINEVEYDEPGVDSTEYIELKNVGSSAANLSTYSVQLVNGASGGAAVYKTIPLSGTLAPGGYFVICANPATFPGCLDVTPDTDLIQNGSPDAMALLQNGAIVDRLSYEGDVPGFTEGTGGPTESGSTANQGLSRCPDGSDTDNNSLDFQLRPGTPGVANDCGGGGAVIGVCGDPATPISQVEGSGPSSPLIGQTVVVEAAVVGDFQEANLNGFYLETPDGAEDANPATSEGIFVFEGALTTAVATGNRVRALGQVGEFDGVTELAATAILVCPGSPVVSTRALAFPVASVADLERYEGMLVGIAQPLTVTGNFDYGRFGSLDLSVGGRLFQPTALVDPGAPAIALEDTNDRSRIILDDASNLQDPNPIPYKDASNTRRVGDTLPSLTGIIENRFGDFRIHPTVTPAFGSGNPRAPTPPLVGGRLRVASFNVLNFFTTLDDGLPHCGPAGTLDCRGANSAAEFDRQRTKLLKALGALNADIVGLIEIENNASAAVQSLVSGLNALPGVGPYAFIDTGTIGTDAIKLAFIYKPAKVAPFHTFALLTSAVIPAFIDTKNRPALAQTFTEVGTGGRVTVVLNHLKSKGSACDDVGDPDLGDGQGNCNVTRTAAAEALVDWIAGDPTGANDPDVLLIGDMNAYAKEDPILAFEDAGFVSLVASFLGASAYSFQFDGQSGYLDHALASPTLTAQVTGTAEWHINADEPIVADYNLEFRTDDLFDSSNPFRASDHDPVLVGLNLVAPPPAVPASGQNHAALLASLLGVLGALFFTRRRRVSFQA